MFTTIVVPLDGTDFSETALPLVRKMISERDVKKVLLVRVVTPTPDMAVDTPVDPASVAAADAHNRAEAERYLQGIALQIPWNGTEYETAVLFGRVPEVLVDYANDSRADLLVLSSHARGGVSRLIRGSLAARMLQSVDMPILLVGAPGSRKRTLRFPHIHQSIRKQESISRQAA